MAQAESEEADLLLKGLNDDDDEEEGRPSLNGLNVQVGERLLLLDAPLAGCGWVLAVKEDAVLHDYR